MIFFTNCAKPPVDKVDALKTKFQDYDGKGAKVFAQAEFDMISQQMTELQQLMDKKDYKGATVLADSLLAKMEPLQSIIESNGKNYTQQAISIANEELGKLNNMLKSKDIKVLGDAVVKKYQAQSKEFGDKISALQNEINSAQYLKAYEDAKTIGNDITMSVQDISKQLDKSKEAKVKSAPKKTTKPVTAKPKK